MFSSARIKEFFISIHRTGGITFSNRLRKFTTNSLLARGFTLIELLVVIAILGILAAAVLVAINPGKRTRQAQDAKRKNDIGAIATEVQGYYTTPGQGTYPTSLEVLTAGSYLKQMPLDPTSGLAYGYATNTGPADVGVWATLAEPTNTPGTWLWCSQTATGKAQEITAGSCTAP